MVARYAHLRAGDLRAWAEVVGGKVPKLGK